MISGYGKERISMEKDEGDSFFVSPEGSDNNDGSIGRPFKTLERGLAGLAGAGSRRAGDESIMASNSAAVFLRQGYYPLVSTVFINSKHSGTISAPVLISSYGNEKVSLSSSVLIPGEAFSKDDGSGGYTVDLAAMGIRDYLEKHSAVAAPALFLNETRLERIMPGDAGFRQGGWQLDFVEGKLLVHPPGKTEMHNSNVFFAASAFELLNLTDVENLVLNGLIFEKSLGSAITVNGGRSVVVRNCVIRNIGGRGISYNKSGMGSITGTRISMTGSHPVSLAGSDDCMVENNKILK